MHSVLLVIIAAIVTAGIAFVLPLTEGVIQSSAVIFAGLLGFKFIADLLPKNIGLPSRNAETGHVKWFNVSKGFGFITRENGEDIFVHYRCIRSNGRGRRILEDGQLVRFEIGQGDKGLQAENVRPVRT